jgi:hypothetical protein
MSRWLTARYRRERATYAAMRGTRYYTYAAGMYVARLGSVLNLVRTAVYQSTPEF